MRNLLRGLGVAMVLASALTAMPAARALPGDDSKELCVGGAGHCSGSGSSCAASAQCGAGQRCICD
jgi:hypothetical protein